VKFGRSCVPVLVYPSRKDPKLFPVAPAAKCVLRRNKFVKAYRAPAPFHLKMKSMPARFGAET